jgi:hypothetical protein
MPSIIAYTYEAAIHCPACTRLRFQKIDQVTVRIDDMCTDREGNLVRPVFSTDETPPGESCDDCHEVLT